MKRFPTYTRQSFSNLPRKDWKMPKSEAATEGMSHVELRVSFPKVRMIYMRKWGEIGQRFYDGKGKKTPTNRVCDPAREKRRRDKWEFQQLRLNQQLQHQCKRMAFTDGCYLRTHFTVYWWKHSPPPAAPAVAAHTSGNKASSHMSQKTPESQFQTMLHIHRHTQIRDCWIHTLCALCFCTSCCWFTQIIAPQISPCSHVLAVQTAKNLLSPWQRGRNVLCCNLLHWKGYTELRLLNIRNGEKMCRPVVMELMLEHWRGLQMQPVDRGSM